MEQDERTLLKQRLESTESKLRDTQAKLEETARTDICMNLFVENLEHQIRRPAR